MAKKEFRIKDKQGNNVDYGIPSSRVMLGNGNSLDEVLEDMQDEIDEADGEAVKKVTFNGGIPATPDEQGNVTINQVKSDWKESDNTSPKFIEHKPDVVEDVFYEEQTRTLKKTVNGVTQEVMTMPQPGSDITINDSMDGPGANPARTDVIKQYIDAVSQRIDTLIGSGNVQGAIDTFNEVKAFLEGISSSETLAAKLALLVPQSRTINSKPLTGNITIGINDIDGLAAAIANAGSGAVSVTTNQDGTFVIHVGETDYTIDLNHEHPQYAGYKTIESTTDATVTLSRDVIYDLGTVAGNKTISLPSTVDGAADYEFRLTYTSGTITLPSGVLVANDGTLTFTAGKIYQVVISGGILYYSETSASA